MINIQFLSLTEEGECQEDHTGRQQPFLTLPAPSLWFHLFIYTKRHEDYFHILLYTYYPQLNNDECNNINDKIINVIK